MDSAQTILALVVLLAPLLAAGAIAAATNRQAPAILVKLGAAVSFCGALAALLRFVGGYRGETWLDLGTWLSTGPDDSLRITLGFELDAVAAGLAALISLAALCALALHGSGLGEASAERLFYLGACVLLSSSIGVVVSTSLGELLVFWELATVSAYMMWSAHSKTTRDAAAVTKFFLVQHLGGLFLLCAVLAFAAGFQTLEFHELFRSPQAWAQSAGQRSALIDFIALCLLGACAARCGFFPFLGRHEDVAAGPVPVALFVQGACLMPLGVLVLIRCIAVMKFAVASWAFGASLGGATAFAAAVCAWAATDVRRTAGFACASLLGTVVFGLFAAPSTMGTWALVLLAVSIPASTVLLGGMEAQSRQRIGDSLPSPHLMGRGQGEGTASTERPSSQPSPRGWERESRGRRIERGHLEQGPINGALLLSIGVLFSGICGQGAILAEAAHAIRRGADDSLNLNGAAIALVFAVSAQFLAAFAISRSLLTGRGADASEPSPSAIVIETSLVGDELPHSQRSSWWPLLLLTGSAFVIGLTGVAVIRSGLTESGGWMNLTAPRGSPLFAVILGYVPGLAGLMAGWRQRRPVTSAVSGRPFGSALMRLGQNRFYCDTFLFLLVSLPVRATAQLDRFIDWFFIDNFITGLVKGCVEQMEIWFDPIQRRAVGFYVVSAVLGTIVLAVAIIWLRD